MRRSWDWLYAIGFPALFSIVASWGLLRSTGKWAGAGDFWFFAWWYWAWFHPVNTPVLVSGAVPFAFCGIIASQIARRRWQKTHGWPIRLDKPTESPAPQTIEAGTDNFGHAHFAPMIMNRERWPEEGAPGFRGLVVGEAYVPTPDDGKKFDSYDRSTWGRGGTAPLLIDDLTEGSTHNLIYAGSGSFKTTSVVIPNLLTFRGPVVCTDPKQNLAGRLRRAREEMGKRVVVLEPGQSAGYNALGWIDPASPLCGIDIDAVVEAVCGYTSTRDQKTAFFKNEGKSLVKVFVANMLEGDRRLATLRTLRAELAVPSNQLSARLKAIAQNSPSAIARDGAAAVWKDAEDSPEMFAGFHRSATRDTAWLGDPAYADLVSGDAFDPRDIMAGDTDVFISLPLKSLNANSAPARCILATLMQAVYDAKGNFDQRILFQIEEAKRIGRHSIFELTRDAGREYKITMSMIYQSPGQLRDDWGDDGQQAWEDSVSFRSYSAIRSPKTAEEVAKALGEYGVLSLSESQNTGSSRSAPMQWRGKSWGRNVTYSWGKRQRMKPEEVMYDLRPDAQIVIPKSGWPTICGRACWFRREDMLGRVD